MRKCLNVFLLIFIFTSTLLAQKKVTGVVTEAGTKEPLIGATILVKGTSNGVVTDIDGKYSITAKAGDVLQFAYVGMQTQ